MIENEIVKQICKSIQAEQPNFAKGYGLGILTENGVLSELPQQGRTDFDSYTINEKYTQFYIRRNGNVKQKPVSPNAPTPSFYSFDVPLTIVANSTKNDVVKLLTATQTALLAAAKNQTYSILLETYETVRPLIFDQEGQEEKANRNNSLAVVSINFTLSFRHNVNHCEAVQLC